MKFAPVAHTLSSVMSVMGQERTLAALDFMSALPPTTDINSGKTDIGNLMSAFEPFSSALPPKADINEGAVHVRY